MTASDDKFLVPNLYNEERNIAALLIALASPPATAAPDATVLALFQPYTSPMDHDAVWTWPVYTRETTALIRAWLRVNPKGEVDALNDADWLCQCQDWDAANFHAAILGRHQIRPGVIEFKVKLLGEDHPVIRLQMKYEGTRWLLDDLFSTSTPKGLKFALRQTAQADRQAHKSAHGRPK